MVLLDKNNRFVIAFDNKHYSRIYHLLDGNLTDIFNIQNTYIVKSEKFTISEIRIKLYNYDSRAVS